MLYKPRFLVAYTFALILMSSLTTTAYFHYFVLGSAENEEPALRFVSDEQVNNSPLKENNTIVEIISYGCHYCAVNEKNVAKLESRLPPGTRLIRLHLSNEQHTGLASFAPVFATLTAMGLEDKYRASAYRAILEQNIDRTDERQLNNWLQANGIDSKAYAKASKSQAVKTLLDSMKSISRFYTIRATPTFIVGNKWVATQDRDFPEFTDQLLSLLEHDKPLEE